MTRDPDPCTEEHGIAGWPETAGSCARVADFLPGSLPDRLPNGNPWPPVHVLVVPSETGADAAVTVASLLGQGYPCLRHAVCADVREAADAVRAGLAEREPTYWLWLRAGDLLAPGALAALCLEAGLSGAGAVAGLRVLFGGGVHGLDVLSDAAVPGPDAETDFGDVLVERTALMRAGTAGLGSAGLWARLGAQGVPRARIGLPVLLARVGGAPSAPPVGRSIAALTDGYGGGGGIAHRRLAEAMALCGHRVRPMRLFDESPAAAAEWTDCFPRTEAMIREGGHDLVLAGNIHVATRGGGLLRRACEAVPTVIVLHDLFALTGRCAHPKDCPVIASGCDARCPSPSEYPQLAPSRIAGAFAQKRAVLAGPHAPLLAANSAWTESRARALAPAGAAVAPIRLAFPAGVFRPRDRAALRRELGLPQDDVLVLFAAVIADAPDKGFSDLAATMRRAARPGIGFVALGRLDDAAVFGLPNLHAPGAIADEETLARWYAACDIYLTASRLETLGQTPIEAGLCGIPTVAYRATGLTSAVVDGVTGLLAEPREGALGHALERLIADAGLRQRLGAYARIVLESRHSHAAAAMSLQAALAAWQPSGAFASDGARMRFLPEMLGRFALARDRHPGETGLVASPSRPLVRRLRRAKQAVFGTDMPLWMRRALYAATLMRQGVRRGLRPGAGR